MEKIKVRIGTKIYNVEVAESDEELEKGLSNRKVMEQDFGMLFVFDKADEISIWMKDTLIPLDIIFLNEDLEVTAVYTGKPESEDLMTEANTSYVLEVNKGSEIKVGDELEFSPSNNAKMQILDEDGNSQMELDGGERIFSRPNTKILIKFAKKANATNKDSDYRNLAKRAFKFLEVQNGNPAEFVKAKN